MTKVSKLPSEERNPLLDNVKGILIFLVVLGHSMELYKNAHVIPQTIYTFIYMFHMPVFVFISGYFSKNTTKAKKSAFKSYFIPYIIFNTIWNTIIAIGIGPSAFSIITPGWALWYLLSMFMWRSFIGDFVRIKYIMPISIVVGLVVGFMGEFDTALSLSRTIVFFPFFLAGYYCKEDQLFKAKNFNKIPSLIIILFTMILAIVMTATDIVPVEFLYGSESFSAHTNYLVGVICRAIFYIIGFLFVFVMINLATSKKCILSKIGRNTFSIYIIHTYMLGIVFGIIYFIDNIYLKMILSLIASVITVFLLSRDHVNGKFFRLLLRITKKITI